MGQGMELINKKILITGATSGIGLKILEQLYDENSIYIIARDQKKIDVLKTQFPKINVINANLTDIEQVQSVVEQLYQTTKTLDVLINNAAVQYTPKLIDDDFKFETISNEITCNFTSICSLCYLLLPLLNQSKTTSIVNINSGLGLMPKTTSAIYCATKAALNSFSQSLRYQLKETNINVLQVFLPMVDTPMTRGRGKAKLTSEYVSKLITQGIKNQVLDNDIGKAKLLRILIRFAPFLARNIMRKH